MISDGFTVEGKGKPVFTIPKKLAPKLLLNTNYTIPAVSRSDRRRVHFVCSVSSMEFSTTHRARRLLTCMADTCLRRATGQ